METTKLKYLNNSMIYLIGAIAYLEVILRIAVFKNIQLSFFYSLFLGTSIAIFVNFFSRIFKAKINRVIYGVVLIFLGMYFMLQIMYYDFFNVFFTLYSLGNGGQALEFWREGIKLIFTNIHWIILCLVPFFGYFFYLRKQIKFKQLKPKKYIYHLILFAVSFVSGYMLLYLPSDSLNTPLDIYQEKSMNEMTVNQFGLTTSLRFDLQTLILGKDDISDNVVVNKQPEKPKKTNYKNQVMDIDFNKLINNTDNQTIKNMHQYFQNVTPTKKNKYTGIFKGYNVIFITAEAFSPYAIRQDVTPTLYKLANEGFQFKNFYTPIWSVSTSDGEYVATQGLVPKGGVWSFKHSANNDLPFTLGQQYQKLGYTTKAYHNHTYTYYGRNLSHPNMGYDYKGLGNGLDVKKQWPESDLEMMEKTVDEYINDKHFHAYYMTVSGHTNYDWNGNMMASKNKDKVNNLNLSELSKGYIASQIELDRALEYLIKRLEKKGIADKTVIALSADHYPYGLPSDNYNELAGHALEQNFELYKNSFLLWSGSMKKPIKVDKLGCSMDILPTLSNLLGLKYDSRLLMGTDLLSDSEPLVIFLNRSFMTDKVMYNAKTNETTWLNNTPPDQEYLKRINNIVKDKIRYSALILDENYYQYIPKKE